MSPHMQAAVTNESTQARGIVARSQNKHALILLPREAKVDFRAAIGGAQGY